MKTLSKILLVVGIFGMAGFVTSCQTASASADASSAVTCDKCKTVWVKRHVPSGPSGKTGAYYALRSVKTMECPECESAVATFFKTGSLKHSCSHCNGTMSHCTNH